MKKLLLGLGLVSLLSPANAQREIDIVPTENQSENLGQIYQILNEESYTSDTIQINLPPAKYGIEGEDIDFTTRQNTIFKGTLPIFPLDYLQAQDDPTTGAFLLGEVDTCSSTTLENLVFDGNSLHNLQLRNPYVTIRGNWFKEGTIFDAVLISPTQEGDYLTFTRNFFNGHSRAVAVGRRNTYWSGNVFKNCGTGLLGNSSFDSSISLGTADDFGGNVFYDCGWHLDIRSGGDVDAQGNYFYSDGILQTEEGAILDRIKDTRPSGVVDVGNFSSSYHPLFPEDTSSVRDWEKYE